MSAHIFEGICGPASDGSKAFCFCFKNLFLLSRKKKNERKEHVAQSLTQQRGTCGPVIDLQHICVYTLVRSITFSELIFHQIRLNTSAFLDISYSHTSHYIYILYINYVDVYMYSRIRKITMMQEKILSTMLQLTITATVTSNFGNFLCKLGGTTRQTNLPFWGENPENPEKELFNYDYARARKPRFR